MNENGDIIKKLGYDGVLLTMPEVERLYPNYRDLKSLGAGECYFIAGHPAALFFKTMTFDQEYAIRISEVLHNAWNYRKVLLVGTIQAAVDKVNHNLVNDSRGTESIKSIINAEYPALMLGVSVHPNGMGLDHCFLQF